MLADLDLELNASGIHLAFAELQSDVRDMIGRYGLLDVIEEGHIYRSVTEAVDAYRSEVLEGRTGRGAGPRPGRAALLYGSGMTQHDRRISRPVHATSFATRH